MPRLFNVDKKRSLRIDFELFIDAIKQGDSNVIDDILQKKRQGYELDINKSVKTKSEHFKDDPYIEIFQTPLEILLEKRDFVNAAKLLKAGASTHIPYTVSYFKPTSRDCDVEVIETRYKSIYEQYHKDEEVIQFLHKELASLVKNQEEQDEQPTKKLRSGF